MGTTTFAEVQSKSQSLAGQREPTSRKASNPFAIPSRVSLFFLKLSIKPGEVPAVRQCGCSAVFFMVSLKKASTALRNSPGATRTRVRTVHQHLNRRCSSRIRRLNYQPNKGGQYQVCENGKQNFQLQPRRFGGICLGRRRARFRSSLTHEKPRGSRMIPSAVQADKKGYTPIYFIIWLHQRD